MFLAAISASKFISANWRIIAIASILAMSFLSGWVGRGYIEEASKNAAIAAAVAETKKQEGELYAKAMADEKRKRAIRERARVASVDIHSSVGDDCSERPVFAGWMQLIQDAYRDGASQP